VDLRAGIVSDVSDNENRAFTPGLTFPAMDCAITRAQQARKLDCCGLDPALYGDRVDITQLAYSAILAVHNAGISINGRVHMAQVFDLREPILLGEPLTVQGEVLSVTPGRRGLVEESRFDFRRPDGSVPLISRRGSVLLDPSAKTDRKPGAARPPEDPRDGLTLFARHQLVPEKVAAYSGEAENLIHSDPETAKRFGYRAPIAAGLMAVHFMMAALCNPSPPARLNMSVRFRRPMFWDEELEVWGRHAADGTVATLSVINPEGKVANDAVIEEVGYAANA